MAVDWIPMGKICDFGSRSSVAGLDFLQGMEVETEISVCRYLHLPWSWFEKEHHSDESGSGWAAGGDRTDVAAPLKAC